MRKINLRDLFIGFIIGGIVFGSIGVAAINLNANAVTYTPTDSSFEVTNVEEAINQMYEMANEYSKDLTVVKLCDLSNGSQTVNLSSYEGYQNFAVGKNIFMLVSGAYGGITGPWGWFRPSDTALSFSLSYNASTGVLTVPSRVSYGADIQEHGEVGGTARAHVSISGSVYLIY